VMDESDRRTGGATVLKVMISEVNVLLLVPKLDSGQTAEERQLVLRGSDVDVKVELNVGGQQETALVISVMDADFLDQVTPQPNRILGRLTPLTLTLHNSPILHFRFTSTIDPETSTKESSLKLSLASAVLYVTKDRTWVNDLLAFVKTPEGVFEDVVPTELTRIQVLIEDCSIHVKGPTCGGGLVLVLGSGEIMTDVVNGSDEGIVEVVLTGVGVLVIDDLLSCGEVSGSGKGVDVWKVSTRLSPETFR
jgi:autophagy-related protein 2